MVPPDNHTPTRGNVSRATHDHHLTAVPPKHAPTTSHLLSKKTFTTRYNNRRQQCPSNSLSAVMKRLTLSLKQSFIPCRAAS